MLLDVEEREGWGWNVSKCSGRPIFIFFIKENWICAMSIHHAEPNIIIYQRQTGKPSFNDTIA